MLEHFLATWRAGWRSHAFRAIVIIAVLLVGLAWLSSSFSGRHPQTVALDVGISGIRFITILLLLFWTQELLGREIDRRTIFIALSYPTQRASYLLGRYLGMIAMLVVAVITLGLAVYFVVRASGIGYKQTFPVQFGSAYLLTLAFIVIDGMVVAAFALLLSSLATTALLPLACGAAFAVIARSYSQVLAFLADKSGEGADIAHTYVPLIDIISWIIPDLGKLDIRDTVLYGQYPAPDTLYWPPLAALAYAGIMLSLACLIFQRREFN